MNTTMLWRTALLAGLFSIAAVPTGDEVTLDVDDGKTLNEKLAYGLRVNSPWKDGGHLVLNLPEHLEYRDGGAGILRYSDPVSSSPWQVSADKKTATMRVESPHAKGLWVSEEVKVVSKNAVALRVKIENKTAGPICQIRNLYCVHYRLLTGFPGWDKGMPYTYVVKGDKLTPLADIPTRIPSTKVKFATFKGCPERRASIFAERYGGTIEEPLDLPLIVVSALDGKRKAALQWTPAGTMLANAAIPCIHCDPFQTDLNPGESGEVTGSLLFTEDPLDQILADFRKSR